MDDFGDPAYLKRRTRRLRIWAAGIALHATLFGALVVYPYLRGDQRATAATRAYGVFVACIYGGEPTGAGGLALPAHERTHHAGLWLRGGPDWPARCRGPLRRVAPAEASLLFPSVKAAEADVRDAVARADAALRVAASARARGEVVIQVPVLDSVARLTGAVAELARSVDATTVVTTDAIRFARDARVPEPARVALNASADAAVRARATADELEVVSVDAHGISHTRVSSGRTRTIRMSRPGLVRGVLFGDAGPVAVFATPAERCVEDATRCSGRTLAAVPFEREPRLPDPQWLGGHPAGRFD